MMYSCPVWVAGDFKVKLLRGVDSMRLVVQRVQEACVKIDGEIHSEIGVGLLVFLGIHREDSSGSIRGLAEKLVHLRIFPDAEGKINRSVVDIGGSILIVSQFSLYADCSKGRRPSFVDAAPPGIAEPLYEAFVEVVRSLYPSVKTGVFGADMKIHLVNDGPLTFILP
jgi:D-tyrosyl-tRNA(Tyr) deacylase